MAATKTNQAGKTSKPSRAAGKAASGSGATGKAASGKPAAGKVAPAEKPKPARRRSYWWLWLIPLVVAGAGAWLWFQYLADLPSRVDELEVRVEEYEELQLKLEELERRRVEDAALLAADAQAARLAAERVRDGLEIRLAAAERGLEAMGSQPAGQQVRWRLDAADRLLALADRQSRFAKDHEGAALAVREALELLSQAGDPRYAVLSAELHEQARSLERVPARDIQGVVVRLGALLSRVEGLDPNLRPSASDSLPAEELPEKGWERAVASTRRVFRSLITVRRTDSGVATLLTEGDSEALQRLLAAELHLARLAYIQGDLQAYSAALVAARGRLSRLYAPTDPDVADTLADIDELLELGRSPQTPDIAASLQRFRSIRSD